MGVSGILTLLSGTPLFVTANGGSLNLPGTTQTANQVAPVIYPHGINVGNGERRKTASGTGCTGMRSTRSFLKSPPRFSHV
jgi:hypothetical protein